MNLLDLSTLQTVAIIATAVWVVAAIRGTTRELNLSVNHLSNQIDALRVWVTSVAERQQAHGERIIRLEERRCDDH